MDNYLMTRGLFIILLLPSAIAQAATITELDNGLTLSVSEDGNYLITVHQPPWTFSGHVGQRLEDIQAAAGSDAVGTYNEISFRYFTRSARRGAIRLYQRKPIVLFTLQLLETGDNESFPSLTTFPSGLSVLTFDGGFGGYLFGRSKTDGPLVEFDSGAATFILSPASHFMVGTSFISDQGIATGVDPKITTLPAGFVHQTMLVIEEGINRAFETWGHALTDLQGKVRPSNDADLTLSHLGYWTDNGARYYYHPEPGTGFATTLLAIRDEFQQKGVPLGYVQLDSWFYPKGPHANWRDGHDGIYEYIAAPELFLNGLKAFQAQLGLPLVTHSRWIDPSSPYRKQYKFSGDVSIDRRYWDTIMTSLREAGVITYEQDWLSYRASTEFNLNDPDAFLGNMARAASHNGLTIQYCLPVARHFLQASKYSNVTTIRTSPDRFVRDRWDRFLYGSRLAGALGVWPWADVFRSSEDGNLLLATLSAGPVGVGDAIGAVDAASLLRAVRKDGVIVKPDVPLVPVDKTFINDAQGLNRPMLATTYTDFGDLRAVYVLAYPRGANLPVSFQPSSLGFEERVYIYDYFAQTGQLADASDTFRVSLTGAYAYYIVAPVGRSGIALLGDAGQFVSLGKQRIKRVDDDGILEVECAFASGETARTVHGYSPSWPAAIAIEGTASAPSYDASTHRFSISVSPGADGSAVVDIVPGGR
jgi:hypothetical protein